MVFFSFWCRNLGEEKEEKGEIIWGKRLGEVWGTWSCRRIAFFLRTYYHISFLLQPPTAFCTFSSLSHTSENLWNANAQSIGYSPDHTHKAPHTRTHTDTLFLKSFVWQHRVVTKVRLTSEACHAQSQTCYQVARQSWWTSKIQCKVTRHLQDQVLQERVPQEISATFFCLFRIFSLVFRFECAEDW